MLIQHICNTVISVSANVMIFNVTTITILPLLVNCITLNTNIMFTEPHILQ